MPTEDFHKVRGDSWRKKLCHHNLYGLSCVFCHATPETTLPHTNGASNSGRLDTSKNAPMFTIEREQQITRILRDGIRVADVVFSYGYIQSKRDEQERAIQELLDRANNGVQGQG